MAKLFQRINDRIAYKLALWVIVFSSTITLVATAVQLYFDYRQDLAEVKTFFESITTMQLQSISQSVWTMDDNQIMAQLEGITRGRDISYAAVRADGNQRWSSGVNNGTTILSLSYDLSYSQRGKQFKLGKLEIVANLDNLYDRLQYRGGILLLTNGLKIFLFAGIMLLLFQYGVTRHLEKLASHVVSMDFRRKGLFLTLYRCF